MDMMQLLLNQLRNKNPEAFNEVQQLMNSGKSPQQVLNDLLASGTFATIQVVNTGDIAETITASNIVIERIA